MRMEMGISTWKKFGDVKAFRPRFPSQPSGGAKTGTLKVVPSALRHRLGEPKVTPGIKGEEVAPPTEGRPVEVLKSRRVFSPVMTLNGLPDENSMIGETVKSATICLKKPSPDFVPADWKTALFTQRCRWSFTELERSRLRKRLS